METNLNKITKKGRTLYLAYDQGLEHGPTEFNDENVDPQYIINIAKGGRYNGVIFQKGIAEKYKKEIKNSGIPLILKLNGRTNLSHGEPLSTQLCTVKEALKLGASAVGFTIYLGSEFENVMLQEFENIQREAHEKGIPVIAWIYPRGKAIEKVNSGDLMAYSARLGLEIGADIVKLKYNGNPESLKWAVKAAGKTKIVVSGGEKIDQKSFLKMAREVMKSGALGMAVGRNVWKDKKPMEITKKIKNILFK